MLQLYLILFRTEFKVIMLNSHLLSYQKALQNRCSFMDIMFASKATKQSYCARPVFKKKTRYSSIQLSCLRQADKKYYTNNH